MAASHTKLLFRFVDREGNKASTTMYVAFSLTTPELTSFINLMAARMQAVSNGFLFSVDAYRKLPYVKVGEATVDADINSRALLYYSTSTVYEAFEIPSPKDELFESEGAYAGIRIDAAAEALVPLIGDAVTTLALLCTPEGEPFPTTYEVGGLML